MPCDNSGLIVGCATTPAEAEVTPAGTALVAQIVVSPLAGHRTRLVTLADMLRMTPRRMANVFARRRNFARRPCACGSTRCPVLVETARARVACPRCRRRLETGVLHPMRLLTKSMTTNDGKRLDVGVATCARTECSAFAHDAMARALPARGLP